MTENETFSKALQNKKAFRMNIQKTLFYHVQVFIISLNAWANIEQDAKRKACGLQLKSMCWAKIQGSLCPAPPRAAAKFALLTTLLRACRSKSQ
jgi:hypothetical protein